MKQKPLLNSPQAWVSTDGAEAIGENMAGSCRDWALSWGLRTRAVPQRQGMSPPTLLTTFCSNAGLGGSQNEDNQSSLSSLSPVIFEHNLVPLSCAICSLQSGVRPRETTVQEKNGFQNDLALFLRIQQISLVICMWGIPRAGFAVSDYVISWMFFLSLWSATFI